VAIETVVGVQARSRIREFLKHVAAEKGKFYLAMLVQSSPDLPDRWSLVVSAPWIDAEGPHRAVSYLSANLKRYLGRNVLSALDRVSATQSNEPLVQSILQFLGLKLSLADPEIPIRDWVVAGVPIVDGFVLLADPDPNASAHKSRLATQKVTS
jgi:hypothetical protein